MATTKTEYKLKFEGIEVGTKIRAYDFVPMKGREECYVEGVIVRFDSQTYKGYIIECTYDSWNDHEDAGDDRIGRVGSEVKVPMGIAGSSEFDERITVIE